MPNIFDKTSTNDPTGKSFYLATLLGDFYIAYADLKAAIISGLSTVTTFLGLTDTPSSYSGQGSKLTKVNAAANALEFTRITEDADGLVTISKATANGSEAFAIKDNNNSKNLSIRDNGDVALTGTRSILATTGLTVGTIAGALVLSPLTETTTAKNIVFTDSSKGLYIGLSEASGAGITGVYGVNAFGLKFKPFNGYGGGYEFRYSPTYTFAINPTAAYSPFLFELGNPYPIGGTTGSYFEINSTAGSAIITRQAPETADYREIFSAGDGIYFGGNSYTIQSVDSATQMTLTTPALTNTSRGLVYFNGAATLGTIMSVKRNGFMKLMPANATVKYATERLEVDGNINLSGVVKIDNTQVLKEQLTGVAAMTNLTAPTNLDADTVTVAELADIVGNLIAKLREHGLVTT